MRPPQRRGTGRHGPIFGLAEAVWMVGAHLKEAPQGAPRRWLASPAPAAAAAITARREEAGGGLPPDPTASSPPPSCRSRGGGGKIWLEIRVTEGSDCPVSVL